MHVVIHNKTKPSGRRVTMMRFVMVMTFVFFSLFAFHLANASFINNGSNLIYDTDLNITWYVPDVENMKWGDALYWVTNLDAGGVTGWRLPTLTYENLNHDQYITTNEILFSEMQCLYYELGNSAGGPLIYKDPFANLGSFNYWTGVTYPSAPGLRYFAFNFGTGIHGYGDIIYNTFGVLAVHSGNVTTSQTPIPSAILLFAPGLADLALVRKRLLK